ncbi:DUF1853 family protein [Paraburkholderia phosphatilytica]|uniref:DUF1853 family protein n=1 Tax=Paraburkholderia phosphatilytica TaxID=2282883 RepID=UPI000E4FB919|nr:DUF1853 family protein [Paraburkholderia phosphatilytica]
MDAASVTAAGHHAGQPAAHDAASLLDDLRDPAVRDLAWLLFGPPLVRAQPAGELAALFGDPADPADLSATVDWLRAQDANPEPLHRELAQSRITRVGRLAETLLAWYLRTGPGPRLVAANVPLRRAGITLGECDFLVETRQGARLHWELAVKCYLHAGHEPHRPSARLADYVGPNLQDRFDLKLMHLLDHQLPLSAREEFASIGHAGPWTPQMLVRGWLFYGPDAMPGAVSVEAAQIDPAHGQGWWVTLAGWAAFAAAHAERWRVLPRLEWLAPRRDGSAQTFAEVDALTARSAERNEPLMVAGFVADGEGGWRERSRGFIVPDGWPALARAFADQ